MKVQGGNAGQGQYPLSCKIIFLPRQTLADQFNLVISIYCRVIPTSISFRKWWCVCVCVLYIVSAHDSRHPNRGGPSLKYTEHRCNRQQRHLLLGYPTITIDYFPPCVFLFRFYILWEYCRLFVTHWMGPCTYVIKTWKIKHSFTHKS